MKCPICASEGVERAVFCAKCGYRFVGPTSPASYYSGSVYDGPPVTHDQVTSRRADRLAIYLIGTGIVLGVIAVVLFIIGFSMLIEESANAPDYLPTSDFISDTTRALIISAGLVGAIAGIVFLWGLVRLVQKSM